MNEMMEQPAPSGEVPMLEPKAIKPFGIIHLVFGGLGVIQIVFGIAVQAFQKAMFSASAAGDEEIVEIQVSMMEKLKGFTYFGYAIQLVLAVLIIRAGLALVKKKKNAIAKSNIWAWSSLAAKVLLIILTFVYVIPVYNEMFEQLIDPSSPGSKEAMQMMKMSATAGGVLGPVVMAIYPILALVILNKKQNVEFLERHGA